MVPLDKLVKQGPLKCLCLVVLATNDRFCVNVVLLASRILILIQYMSTKLY